MHCAIFFGISEVLSLIDSERFKYGLPFLVPMKQMAIEALALCAGCVHSQ